MPTLAKTGGDSEVTCIVVVGGGASSRTAPGAHIPGSWGTAQGGIRNPSVTMLRDLITREGAQTGMPRSRSMHARAPDGHVVRGTENKKREFLKRVRPPVRSGCEAPSETPDIARMGHTRGVAASPLMDHTRRAAASPLLRRAVTRRVRGPISWPADWPVRGGRRARLSCTG